MKLYNVDILQVRFRRPGLSKIDFVARYDGYFRRGTVVYDTISQKFLSHTKDVDLLAGICTNLQKPRYQKSS